MRDANVVDKYEEACFTVEVVLDECADGSADPRQWENLGTLICWHPHYKLGDEQVARDRAAIAERVKGCLAFIPIYLLDHSGLAISPDPFGDPWDSGQVGVAICTRAKAREYWPELRGEQLKEHVVEALRQEIKTYGAYVAGEVYGYVVRDPDGEELDSCWGYVGEANYAMQEGKSVLAHRLEGMRNKSELAAAGGL